MEAIYFVKFTKFSGHKIYWNLNLNRTNGTEQLF